MNHTNFIMNHTIWLFHHALMNIYIIFIQMHLCYHQYVCINKFLFHFALLAVKPAITPKPHISPKPSLPAPAPAVTAGRTSRLYPAPKDNTGKNLVHFKNKSNKFGKNTIVYWPGAEV